VQSNGSISGFIVQAEEHIKAIGVYIRTYHTLFCCSVFVADYGYFD
jgi:hypothetical protein